MENTVMVYKNLLPKVTTVGKFEVKKPWIHNSRQLNINTMLYVLEGCVYVTENNIKYEIPKNHVFFFKEGCHQIGKKEIPAGSKWYWVSFESFHKNDLDKSLNHHKIELPKLIECPNMNQVSRILQHMEEVYIVDSPYKSQLLDAGLHQIFYELLTIESHTIGSTQSIHIVPKIIRILNTQLEEKFCAEDVADSLGMNYSYLGRCFKEKMGMTINQYYMELKVKQAINLFHTSDMNISEVSERLKYPNPYYFSRVFKKVTGMSPSNYKQHMYYIVHKN